MKGDKTGTTDERRGGNEFPNLLQDKKGERNERPQDNVSEERRGSSIELTNGSKSRK